MCLLVSRDESAADRLYSDTVLEDDEYLYLRACVHVLNGEYYRAYQRFTWLDYNDSEARAEACARPWPKNGEIYRNSKYKGTKTTLIVKIDQQNNGEAAFIKLYASNGDLVSCLFISKAGKATAKIPADTYTIKIGTGDLWFGPEYAFGENGEYEILIFEENRNWIWLKAHYRYQINLDASEHDPKAGSLSTELVEYDDF